MIYFTINMALCLVGIAIFKEINIRHKLMELRKPFIKLPSKTTIIIICLFVYILAFIIISEISGNKTLAVAIGIFPAAVMFSALDLFSRFMEKRETSQITYFLMNMAKWSCVKNDLVYCLDKTNSSGIRGPMGKLVKNALGRIYTGMDISAAIQLMETEALSEDMRYLARNIRFAAEKGGDLRKLFKGMEEQFFMIDEEYFKRKISTLRDRMAVYLMMIMVLVAAIWFIASNPVAQEFYTGNAIGQIILVCISIIFGGAVVFVPGRTI